MAYEKIRCPCCDALFAQEKRFVGHLKEVHGIDDDFTLFLKTFHAGVHPKCVCSGECESLLTWSGWKSGFTSKYARGHNARVYSIYNDPERRQSMVEKRRDGFKAGKYSVWNKGLDKGSSDKIKDISEKISATLTEGHSSGRIVDWRADAEKAQAASKKSSFTKKLRYSTGETVAWNSGLTKETHASVERTAEKVSQSYRKREAGKRLSVAELLDRVREAGKFTLVSDPECYRRRRVDRMLFQCNACGSEQSKSLAMFEESPVCFECHPKESTGQLEIYEFVKALGHDVHLSARDVIPPKEIDVWVPSKNLAIEYNGLYWHSSECKQDTHYHYKKLLACREVGVSLLSIYEDEWRDKKDIIKGMIRHRLMGCDRMYNARSLVLGEVSPDVAKVFFDSNHLEGHVVGLRYLGLFEPETRELLAAVSIRRPFHRKYAGGLELGRCCTKLGCNVRGWLGKLSSAASQYVRETGASVLMTYVDMRVGTGAGYTAAGWKHVETGKEPRFWWTDFNKRMNRFSIRADSKNGISQADAAREAKVFQIFGMPNIIFHLPI